MAKTRPTARSLGWLRQRGYVPDIVECWNVHAGKRKDLYGIIDLIAIHPVEKQMIGIQVTAGSSVSAHIKKIRESDKLDLWLSTGSKLWVMGWRKLAAYNKDGSRAKRDKWTPRVIEITYDGEETLHS